MNGIAVLDDSASLTIDDGGWFVPRPPDTVDLYVFAYGRDFVTAIRDFYVLTGPQPLLPRYALGNWWSRYHPYSDPEYRELIREFERANLPFSVGVLDMDWHLVDIDPKIGSGWTGY
ncbi:MAG TPA: TIM-barrel domain-containing protein, partial [Propionibacteriaceae bacterium]|nr:TIM-barrel domain-containing protein [Propionibacteriaceae bacterium]